ncbi:MAG: hypothetical protein ABIH82_05100 [Candidatus Woesearchaeota archaeon]
MDLLRELFDSYYDLIKPLVFKRTAKNPQKAHESFLKFCKILYKFHLSKFILEHKDNNSILHISNAAGFNKNGEFPLQVLRDLGFNRVVVGTVTNDSWLGNPQPNIRRYPQTESIVNWMGLPGVGAKNVAKNLSHFSDSINSSYKKSNVPVTINLMSTPQKKGQEVLEDIECTILATRDLKNVDRFELNISCPNTHNSSGKIDSRKENLSQLDQMLCILEKTILQHQKIFLKVSPDSTEKDVDDIISIAGKHKIAGFVTTNTTTNHDRNFIPISPTKEGEQIGGASGNAVYQNSLRVQKLFFTKRQELNPDWQIIACGGINSVKKLKERLAYGTSEIQVMTPFIYSGPRLLRRFHSANNRWHKLNHLNTKSHNFKKHH